MSYGEPGTTTHPNSKVTSGRDFAHVYTDREAKHAESGRDLQVTKPWGYQREVARGRGLEGVQHRKPPLFEPADDAHLSSYPSCRLVRPPPG